MLTPLQVPAVNTMSTSLTATASGFDRLTEAVLTVYSKELWLQAQPVLRFLQAATVKTELNSSPGHTITMNKYFPLQSGEDKLTEGTAIIKGNLDMSTVTIKVDERGRAVQVSEFLLRTSFQNIMDDAAKILGRHMAESIDSALKWTLLGFHDYLFTNTTSDVGISASCLYANEKADRSQLLATDVFNADLVRDGVAQLAENKAPKFGGDYYLCYLHPQQAKNMRKDPAWVNANNYASPENILTGEIGRFEDVRFIETTMVPYVDTSGHYHEDGVDVTAITAYNSVAESTLPTRNTYRAMLLGENCLGFAAALPGEMRDDGIEDFKRKHSLAWYGIWGAGTVDADFGTILESA